VDARRGAKYGAEGIQTWNKKLRLIFFFHFLAQSIKEKGSCESVEKLIYLIIADGSWRLRLLILKCLKAIRLEVQTGSISDFGDNQSQLDQIPPFLGLRIVFLAALG
jgi:hypothetical protein